jgi:hypothetical protein
VFLSFIVRYFCHIGNVKSCQESSKTLLRGVFKTAFKYVGTELLFQKAMTLEKLVSLRVAQNITRKITDFSVIENSEMHEIIDAENIKNFSGNPRIH